MKNAIGNIFLFYSPNFGNPTFPLILVVIFILTIDNQNVGKNVHNYRSFNHYFPNESKHFTDNYCGNRWLDYYNECGVREYFPGGIGFCGSWGSTLIRMITCGKDEDFRSNNQTTIDRFCDCLPCEFKDAAKSTSYPYL